MDTTQAVGTCCLVLVALFKYDVGLTWKEAWKTKEPQRPKFLKMQKHPGRGLFMTARRHRHSTLTFSKRFLIICCFLWCSSHAGEVVGQISFGWWVPRLNKAWNRRFCDAFLPSQGDTLILKPQATRQNSPRSRLEGRERKEGSVHSFKGTTQKWGAEPLLTSYWPEHCHMILWC